ncbi:MAG: hypothetical protein ACRDRJ_11070, partial [Streptosporangiaceae bacterium]
MNPLILQCREERFGHRIIIAYSRPACRIPQAETSKGSGELRRCVITPPIMVEDRTRMDIMVPYRHHDSVFDERRL